MNHHLHSRKVSAATLRVALAASLCCWALSGQAQGPSAAVAEVTLMVGEAVVFSVDGSSKALSRGMSIHVGDRIETAGNGHVHMRFTDKGAVSIRPDSIFEILAFQYNQQDPRSNEVRFRVDRGTARSISGAATEHDLSLIHISEPTRPY